MADRVSELAERGRALPPEERVRLLDLLLESLQDTGDAVADEAWKSELERRVARYERGESTLRDADEVIAEAVRRLR